MKRPSLHPPESEKLERYLADRVSIAERLEVEQWMRENPRASTVVDRYLTHVVGSEVRPPDASVTLQYVRARMTDVHAVDVSALESTEQQVDRSGAQSSHRTIRSRLGAMLTSLSIPGRVWSGVIGIAAIALVVFGRPQQDIVDRYGKTPSGEWTYGTANGQRATITLPDGSIVHLNVASRIDIPSDYESGHRTVHLSGEALFQVKAQTDVPFTVVAGSSTTQVLGTRFLVRKYHDDSTATIAVQDGKVRVGTTIVTSAQRVEVLHDQSVVTSAFRTGDFSFTDGTLTLSEMSVERAIPDFNRWYDADIRLGTPAIAMRTLGGEFPAGSLSDLSTLLELTLDVRVVRSGRVLTLYPK